MKNKFITYFLILSCHLGLSAGPDEVDKCSNTDFAISAPDYAETEEEKVLRLEQELLDALNQFDSCLEPISNSQSSSSASSNASNSASGDEPLENMASQEPSSQEPSSSTEPTQDTGSSKNGAIPEDIPSGVDDDVIAKQYRRVAEAETDPAMKRLYWDAYLDYKGIKKKE
jgi:hypothetical protein